MNIRPPRRTGLPAWTEDHDGTCKDLERRDADKAKALAYLQESLNAIEDRVGNDADWKRVRRHLERLTKFTHYEWQYLPLMPYQEYLQTEHWERTRQKAFERANFRCQVCNAKDKLQTHHRTYENLGVERDEDLIVLCDGCHGLFHQNRKLQD